MPNYGTPINPNEVPAGKAVTLRTVALGFTTGAEAPQLPPGMSSRGSNFLTGMGGLRPRPGLLNSFGTVRDIVNDPAGWVGEYAGSGANLFPTILASVFPAWFSNESWSTLSQTGPAGLSGNTLSTTPAYFDATMYFHPTSDEYELCFVNGDETTNTAFTWNPVDDGGLFSTLTNAPRARYVTAFDNRLVFGYASGSPQRIAWSGRGDPETYTAPDGGFEELLDMNGAITRVMSDGDRLLVFSEREVWYGAKAPFPFTFAFAPLDRSVGAPAGRSVARTPLGTVFLGNDHRLYRIPTGGSPTLFAPETERLLRDGIHPSFATLACGVWVDEQRSYLLTYGAIGSGGDRREHGVMVTIDEGRTNTTPVAFQDTANWKIRCLGTTSHRSTEGSVGQTVSAQGQPRVLVGDSGVSASGITSGGVMEFTSRATNDGGALGLNAPTIDCRYFTVIGNPDPSRRQYVREIRLDYRCASASSVSVRLSADFGTTYPIDRGIALPAAVYSAQTVIPVGLGGQYVGVELRHASGHSFSIQGATALVEDLGRG